MHKPEERFIWVDMETTGLDPEEGVPLELGFIVTDVNLNEIARRSWLIWEDKWDDLGMYEAPKVDPYVLNMHEQSGLWSILPEQGESLFAVQGDVAYWLLEDVGIGVSEEPEEPLCGSSVQFDREWMNKWFADAVGLFTYRNIDISTLKELMKRHSPEIYKTQGDTDYYLNRKIHRVLPDLEDTISEYRFYRNEFLYVPSDFI